MNVQREAIRDFKIENASTFSQVTVPVSPLCSPPPSDHLHTAPSCHPPSPPPPPRPIGGMSLATEADLTPTPAQAVPASGSGQLAPPGFYCLTLFIAPCACCSVTHTLTSPHLSPVSSLTLTAHIPIPPFLLSPHSPTLQPILKAHVNDELG